MSKSPALEISERQAHALGILRVLILRNPDLAPPLTEVAKYLDISKQAAGQILAQLQRKGYIERSGRAIRLTGKKLPYPTMKGMRSA